MIDLSKSCVDHLSKGSSVKNNIRFHLAKAKMDEYFLKWLHLASTKDLIENLLTDVKGTKQLISQQP